MLKNLKKVIANLLELTPQENRRVLNDIEKQQRDIEKNIENLQQQIQAYQEDLTQLLFANHESEQLNMVIKEVLGIRNKLWENDWTPNQNIRKHLFFQAGQDTAKYILNNMYCAKTFPHPEEILDFAIEQVEEDGLILEFGVYSGKTINQIADRLPHKTVYGFDSFQGLPEDWRSDFYKGTFTRGHVPEVKKNVCLVQGWFDDTLHVFAKSHSEKVAFIHVDCDLYSSTKTIFEILGSQIGSGTIILFDEYFNYPGWENGEFKAFQEFIQNRELKYQYLAYCDGMEQVALKIV